MCDFSHQPVRKVLNSRMRVNLSIVMADQCCVSNDGMTMKHMCFISCYRKLLTVKALIEMSHKSSSEDRRTKSEPSSVQSMDGFKGKSTGNHRFSHQIWGFPVNFPLNQSIDPMTDNASERTSSQCRG